jgi:predicted nucleic acid-binding protein
VRVTVDTNVVIRAIVRDDEKQAKAATNYQDGRAGCGIGALLVRVRQGATPRLHTQTMDIQAALEALLDARNVAVDRSAAEPAGCIEGRRRLGQRIDRT